MLDDSLLLLDYLLQLLLAELTEELLIEDRHDSTIFLLLGHQLLEEGCLLWIFLRHVRDGVHPTLL